ncbi:hypothetical protein FB478_11434 [Arthrobacter sp. AG367]|uniref:NADPH-dependent F420 reductase n=1 Tax=Arthrobacter sp. AG367 TaxID=2572909 RepID=UPI0011A8B839|nr:NADPH-dependent F420 reductase [Arthrobacter sp. AG367]TWD47078.1 hypothetical protein FB478_11434 [Arthrobacter sp. AG367]
MAEVSIIGTGNMGQAIADIVAKGGHGVQFIAHADKDKTITGDIAVLAVPYPALSEIISSRADQLAGKVVVDITNPVNFETFDSLTVPSDSSATAELAAALPDSHVVKAFNTNFAATLTSGLVGGVPTTVFIAGDNTEAKSSVSDVITAGGLTAVDAGSLARARELEAMGFQQIALAASEKISWSAGFALLS